MKNKIGWCDRTFNPVGGCLNHCEYCYARGIAKRFWKQMCDKECIQEILDTMGTKDTSIITKES